MKWANLLHIYQPPHWDARVIDRVVRESYRPVFDFMEKNPRVHITLNINASLTEQLAQLGHESIIATIRRLAERGQVEFTGSAKYHPILPLLPADEVRRQIHLNTETNRSLFGDCYQPRGFFPPEMAISLDLVRILAEFGFAWVAIDELAASGRIGKTTLTHSHTISPFSLRAVVRNRAISDYLSFVAPSDRPAAFHDEVEREKRFRPVLVTAFDGENLGHHRPGTDKLWEQLVTDPDVETVTYSQAIDLLTAGDALQLTASSWSTQEDDLKIGVPYPLWNHPDNALHQLQWSLVGLIVDAVNRAKSQDDMHYEAARHQLDEALASDAFWWASATPWWSVEIVLRGAQRLAEALDHLSVVPKSVLDEARQLVNAIVELTQRWQNDGTAARRRQEYIRTTSTVKYLGGQRIDSGTA